MVTEEEITRLFMKLKEGIKRDEEAAKKEPVSSEFRVFLEGVVEGRKLSAYEMCKHFEDIERDDLAKSCKEILEVW